MIEQLIIILIISLMVGGGYALGLYFSKDLDE